MQPPIWAVSLILTASSCRSEGAFSSMAGRGEDKTLRISIERSGGFAGITMKTAVDEKDLAPEEAQKLHEMVEETDFINLPGKIISPSPQPDRFQYELSLEKSGRQYTVTVSEEAMPEKLRPLVKWLIEKARHAKKR
jgi:Emfourin